MIKLENIEIGKEYFYSVYDNDIMWWLENPPYKKGRATYFKIKQHVFSKKNNLITINQTKIITKSDLAGFRGKQSVATFKVGDLEWTVKRMMIMSIFRLRSK